MIDGHIFDTAERFDNYCMERKIKNPFWEDQQRFSDRVMPCDCADRQCSMECAYFGKECPRMKEELKTPEILGFNGRFS